MTKQAPRLALASLALRCTECGDCLIWNGARCNGHPAISVQMTVKTEVAEHFTLGQSFTLTFEAE